MYIETVNVLSKYKCKEIALYAETLVVTKVADDDCRDGNAELK